MQMASIDAGVLAVPMEEDGAERIHDYVDTLLDWHRLLEESWISVHLSERASELLAEEGLFPLRVALQKAFKENGIVEYDVNTVAQVAERLLQLTPSFEAYFRVRDVLLEQLETKPALMSLTIGQNMAEDLGRCVVLMAILRRHCGGGYDNHCLIVRGSAGLGEIYVRAIIHDIEHARDDMEFVPTAPEIFEGTVLACHNFRGFLESIDEVATWRTASDDAGKELAIQIAVYKSRLDRQLEPEWDDYLRIRIGRHFVKLADEICLGNPDALLRSVLRSIIETEERLDLAATHVLREDQGGGSPQRQRRTDGAVAWRRDIDREYHLHYWECPDGTAELASMGPHNDFSIPE